MPTYAGPMAGFSPAQITALAMGGNPEWMAKDSDLQRKVNDSLYKTTAKKIGITNLNSWNDVQQVENYLAKSGGSGTGSGSSGQSGTSASGTGSGSGSSSSGSSGGGGGSSSGGSGSSGGNVSATDSYNQAISTLNQQGKLGQTTAQNQIAQTSDLQKQYDALLMSNQSASKSMVDYMNFQALQTGFGQAQQQMQLQFDSQMQQAQFAASQNLALLQMVGMQQQQAQMMAAAAEQARIAQNMARAYVPPVEKTAGFTPVGDLRAGQQRTGSKLSELTDLALLPGAATTSGKKTMTNTLVVA